MKNGSYSVMAVTKDATHTAINPRSLQYLMETGFVPLVQQRKVVIPHGAGGNRAEQLEEGRKAVR